MPEWLVTAVVTTTILCFPKCMAFKLFLNNQPVWYLKEWKDYLRCRAEKKAYKHTPPKLPAVPAYIFFMGKFRKNVRGLRTPMGRAPYGDKMNDTKWRLAPTLKNGVIFKSH